MASKADENDVMSYTLRTSRDVENYIKSFVSLYKNPGGDNGRFRHQGATAAILGPHTPYRGLVVAHELGTGKTMTSIRVTESSARTTWVITKAALSAKSAIANAIHKLDAQSDNEVNKRYENLQQAFFTSDILKENDDRWIGDKRLESVETKRLRIKRVNELYKFIHYNGGLSMLRDLLSDVDPEDVEMTTVDRLFKVLRGDSPNPFDHHTIVVDECHNISEGILNTLDTQKSGIHWSSPPANYAALYALLTRAVDCKIVLLTATPIVNDSFSAALLCNLAAGHQRVIPVKRKGSDRDNRISLLKRVLAAMPDKWTNRSPIAVTVDHTRGTRALIHIAPFGTRFKTITDPHVVEPYADEQATITSSARRRRWNNFVNQVNRACKIAKLDILADEFAPPPFPSPISVKHNGALLFDTSSVETYHRMFDPSEGHSTAFVQGALGLVSRYKVPVDSSWANVTYHADKKKGISTKETKDMSYMSCVMYTSHKRYYLAVKQKYSENSIVSVPTTQAALAHKNLVDELEAGTINSTTGNLRRIKQSSVKYYRLLKTLFGLKKNKKKQKKRERKLNKTRSNTAKKALIFCSLRKMGGVETIARLLQFYGMVEVKATSGEFTYHKWNNGKSEDIAAIPENSHPAMRFAVYKGDMDKDARTKIINAYKQYDTINPEDHTYDAQAFSILLMTTAGAEGLNTRAVEEVHVMTPFWHNVQLQQVVGRARRADSHSHWESKKDKNIDVYVYIATTGDLTTTTDEDMWRVAKLKLNVSNWVDKYGMELGSIDWWAKQDISARQLTLLETIKKYRSVSRFKRGESMKELLCDDYKVLKDKHAYWHTLKCAEYTSCASAAMFSHGGIRRSFDGLREISATPRLLHGDICHAPRYDATPWILPIINNKIRTHYDGGGKQVTYGCHLGEKFTDRKDSNFDLAIKETRRIFQSMRWPNDEDEKEEATSAVEEATRQVQSSEEAVATATTVATRQVQSSEAVATGTTALLNKLYGKSTTHLETKKEQEVGADAPLRLLFPSNLSQVTDSLNRNVNLSYFTRAITLDQQIRMTPVESKYYAEGGAGKTGTWKDVKTNDTERCDVWNAYGHHFRGPRPELLKDGLRRASSFVQGCVRCSSNVMAGKTLSVDTQQVCTGNNKYEPVRECVSTDVLADMFPMVRTMLEFPPSMHNISPDIEGDTINIVNFLTFPVQNIKQILRPIRRFSKNKRSYWFEYHEPDYSVTSRPTTALLMSSVTKPQITSTLKNRSPWRRLLPDTSSLQTQLTNLIRISNRLLTLRSSQRSSIWHVAEKLLMPYRTVLNELHPANKLRRLVRDLDAALRHMVVKDSNILPLITPSQSSKKSQPFPNKFTRSLGYGVIPRETDVWYLKKYALETQHSTRPSIHPDDVFSDIANPGTIATHNDVRTKKKLSTFLTKLQTLAIQYIPNVSDVEVPRNWEDVVRWAITRTQKDTTNTYNQKLFNVLLFLSFIEPKLKTQIATISRESSILLIKQIYNLFVEKLKLSKSSKRFFATHAKEVYSTAKESAKQHPLWGLSSGNPFSGKAGDSIARARRKSILTIAAKEPRERRRATSIVSGVETNSKTNRYPSVKLNEEIIKRRTTHPGAVSDSIIKISTAYKEKEDQEEDKRVNLPKVSCTVNEAIVKTDCFDIKDYTNYIKDTHDDNSIIRTKRELTDHIDYVWKKYWGSKRQEKDEEDDVITGNVAEGGESDEDSDDNGDGNGEGPAEPIFNEDE